MTLGPLHLDLVGLVVDLNQVNLNVTAQLGPGNLLGNLLRAVSNLLNNSGSGGGITNAPQEQIAAFIRPAPGHTPNPDELIAYCRESLAPHKKPSYWTVLEEFPLTPSGKVQKFVLRERFLVQAPEAATQAEGPNIAAAAQPTP